MRRVLGIVVTLVVVLAVAGAGFLLYGRQTQWTAIAGDPDTGPYDFSALTRSASPNDALLCSPGLCEGLTVDGPLPVYEMAPDALMAALAQAIDAQPDRKERVDGGADPLGLRYVTWTETLRFPDTSQFLAVDLGDGRTGLIAYARAQIGRSDMGNNRARLERWTAAIDTGG